MITIGIMGAGFNNPNHGCMALLYSLLYMLDTIEKEESTTFQYILFDWHYDTSSLQRMSKVLSIPQEKFIYAPYVMKSDLLRNLYHYKDFQKMKRFIKRCDWIIDITEGDSFSDIYGDFLFLGKTNIKKEILKLGIPLILGPQTYGPYQKEANKRLAGQILQQASLVLTRDKDSQVYVQKEFGVHALLTSDLAFQLPFQDYEIEKGEKIKVGINASSILYTDEELKDRKFQISVDYPQYIHALIKKLQNCDVYLISHVNDDYKINQQIHQQYPQTHLVPMFENPVQAKSCIAQMDIFIGARMHGTIAAFSTGVACIPTAYSKKFKGLFQTCGYSPLVDLTTCSTQHVIDQTLYYVEHYKDLEKEIQNATVIESCKDILKQWIL